VDWGSSRRRFKSCQPDNCPRYQAKRPPDNSPGAIFMPGGNTFGNVRNANDFLGTGWELGGFFVAVCRGNAGYLGSAAVWLSDPRRSGPSAA
jgi:hypothetical protein